jgi:putative effector of murein hydrolase LrgA (UPF0299 family)
MLRAFAVAAFLLIAGDMVLDLLGAPMPGALLGLAALAAAFAARGGPDAGTARLFDAFMPYSPMLFVPAAVGVVASFDLLVSAWLSALGAIVLGTAATLVVTGAIAQILLGLTEGRTRRI